MFAHLTFFRQRALAVAVIAAVIVFVLWNVPALSPILYPFRLFVTFIHESGHGVAALITGGSFGQMVVSADGSGYASTSGGLRAIILPAGYLGAALFGAVLFYATNTFPFPKTIAFILAVIIAVLTVFYTQIFSLAFIVGLATAAVLLLLWRWRRVDRGLTMLALNLLAIVTGLNAVLDLYTLTRIADIPSAGRIGTNDAAAFSSQVAPILPATGWAIIWALLSIVILLASVYLSFLYRRWRRS